MRVFESRIKSCIASEQDKTFVKKQLQHFQLRDTLKS